MSFFIAFISIYHIYQKYYSCVSAIILLFYHAKFIFKFLNYNLGKNVI